MNKNLSLLKYCALCKARCCRTGKFIGSPILSKMEMTKLKKLAGGHFKEIKSPSGEKYYIIKECRGTNRCFFLTKENKCSIQHKKNKPLDCLCYPIKAIYKNNLIKFIIDTKCPAAKHLNAEFMRAAKRIALKSIKNFHKLTYQHWLKHYVGWVRRKWAVKLEK